MRLDTGGCTIAEAEEALKKLGEAARDAPKPPLWDETIAWASLPWWRRIFTPRPVGDRGIFSRM